MNSGAHYITDGNVTQNHVAAANARKGMISPAVQHLTTQRAHSVVIPERHTETTLQSRAKEGGRDMGASRRRVGREPGPSSGTRHASRWRRR